MDIVPENFLDITPLEVHDNLSMDPNAANYVEYVLSQNSRLIDAQVLATNTSIQRGIHRGGLAPALPLGANLNFQINLDDDGFQLVTLPASMSISTVLADIATAITTAVQALAATKKKASTLDVAFTGFTCTVETVEADQRLVLQSGTNTSDEATSTKSSVRIQNATSNNATVLLKLGPGNGGHSEDALAVRRPAKADAIQIGDAAIAAPVTAVTAGTDGMAAIDEMSFRNAFMYLDDKTDFSLLAVPGENTTIMVDEGMNYCQQRPLQDVFYIGETMETDDTPEEAEDFRAKLTRPNSYGAIYFPWIRALDPSGKSPVPILLPPSGYVAGLYARIDASRGVWKAPAGTEASLGGAVGLAANLTDVQQGILNPKNINVIRQFAASGIVSWGREPSPQTRNGPISPCGVWQFS